MFVLIMFVAKLIIGGWRMAWLLQKRLLKNKKKFTLNYLKNVFLGKLNLGITKDVDIERSSPGKILFCEILWRLGVI